MKPLTPAQRQFLKGVAHNRQPVVMIGNQGLTAAVLKEIERGLDAHELIKIKAASDEPHTRRAWLEEICTASRPARVPRDPAAPRDGAVPPARRGHLPHRADGPGGNPAVHRAPPQVCRLYRQAELRPGGVRGDPP